MFLKFHDLKGKESFERWNYTLYVIVLKVHYVRIGDVSNSDSKQIGGSILPV